VGRQNDYHHSRWVVVNGASLGGSVAQADRLGPEISGHPALVLHPSNEPPAELLQWQCTAEHCRRCTLLLLLLLIDFYLQGSWTRCTTCYGYATYYTHNESMQMEFGINSRTASQTNRSTCLRTQLLLASQKLLLLGSNLAAKLQHVRTQRCVPDYSVAVMRKCCYLGVFIFLSVYEYILYAHRLFAISRQHTW